MKNKSSTHFGGMEHLSLARLPSSNPATIEEFVLHKCYTITPIEHDYAGKTPAMWNAVYKYFGIDSVMAMMVGDPQNAEDIIHGFREDPKYIGGGSGVGFKDNNAKLVDELDPLARAMGSINLIQKLPSGKLKGWNTDGVGYRRSLEDLLQKNGKKLEDTKIVVLGAGGTGNAVAFALAERGAQVVVLNRTLEKAEELARRINEFVDGSRVRAGSEDLIEKEVSDASVVINVSTKGATGLFEAYSALAPAKLPPTPENISVNLRLSEKIFGLIPKDAILSDVVLRATPSPFLEMARAHGFKTLDGVPMVVNQGVEAFLIIHGNEVGTTDDVRSKLQEIMQKAANI